MGFYIETPENLKKADQLIELYQAIKVEKPSKLADVPADKALICVVENIAVDAAALVYSDRELHDFDLPEDTRPKTWLLMDKQLAYDLSGYAAALKRREAKV